MKLLIIKFDFPGFHYWKNAPKKYGYLSVLHRHVFNWIIKIKVQDDREIEFIDLKDKITRTLNSYYNMVHGNQVINKNSDYCECYDLRTHLHFGAMSVEEIASETNRIIIKELNIKPYSVAVFEDQENGAELTEE